MDNFITFLFGICSGVLLSAVLLVIEDQGKMIQCEAIAEAECEAVTRHYVPTVSEENNQ